MVLFNTPSLLPFSIYIYHNTLDVTPVPSHLTFIAPLSSNMNFEPCNPPVIDPLYLTGLSLQSDVSQHRTYLRFNITLSPEKKIRPVRPVPVRPDPKTTSSPTVSGYTSSSLLHTTSSATASTRHPISTSSCTMTSHPTNQTSEAGKTNTARSLTPATDTLTPNVTISHPDHPLHSGPGYFRPLSSGVTLQSHEVIATPSAHMTSYRQDTCSSGSSDHSRNTTPLVTGSICDNPRKISPVQSLKNSSRSGRSSSPYNSSPNSSPDSTPCTTTSEKRRNERHGISETQARVLKGWFSRYTYLTAEIRSEVSRQSELPEKTVMYWFQNQRRKVKRETFLRT